MTERPDFMVPASPREMADGALLTLVHQLVDRLGRVESKIDATREDVIAIKNNRTDERIEELKSGLTTAETRIRQLEDELNQRKGAVGVLGWMTKHAPWMIGLLGIGVAGGVLADKKIL